MYMLVLLRIPNSIRFDNQSPCDVTGLLRLQAPSIDCLVREARLRCLSSLAQNTYAPVDS